MKLLNSEQFDAEVQSGTGYIHFMGGCSSQNGKIIVAVNDDNYLFLPEEIGNKDYLKLMKMQEVESDEWCTLFWQTPS